MDLLEICNKVIKYSKSKDIECEAYICRSKSIGTKIEKNNVTKFTGNETLGLSIRTLQNSKLGFSYCTNFDDEILKQTIENALKSSIPVNFRFLSTKVTGSTKNYYKSVEDMESNKIIDSAESIINSALEINKNILIARGGIGINVFEYAIANTQNTEFTEKITSVDTSAEAVLKDKTISTGFETAISCNYDINFLQVGRNAAELAVKSQTQEMEESGIKTIIFTPYALRSLLEFTFVPAIYGEMAELNESIFSNKIGKKITDENLSIIDNGLLDNSPESSIVDDEGIDSKITTILENGILRTYLYDLRTALQYNKIPTGNGIKCEKFGGRSYKSQPRTSARNIILQSKIPEKSLIESSDDCLLIYSVLGAHTANVASGDFSVNSSLLFKIKKGDIAYACKPMMLYGNIKTCLENVIGVGMDYKLLSGTLTTIATYLPSCKIGNIKASS